LPQYGGGTRLEGSSMTSSLRFGVLGLTAMTILLLAIPDVFARDVTFSCSDPPDRSARVAVVEGATVNKTQDKNEKRCTFSVNGAKAESPSATAIFDGVNSFRKGAPIIADLSRKSVDNLAYAMLVTAPVSEIPNDVRSFLTENAERLADCLQRFFSGSEPPNFTLSSSMGMSGYCRRYEAPQYLDITITWGQSGQYITSLYVHRATPTFPQMPPR
jgi:hypothetical protein